jgi:hypothetical protein
LSQFGNGRKSGSLTKKDFAITENQIITGLSYFYNDGSPVISIKTTDFSNAMINQNGHN